MTLLAFDTATEACSAALIGTDGGDGADGASPRVIAAAFEPMRRGHAERLATMVAELMDEAGLGFSELERLAVTIGPGTFTGTRLAVAFARGLALAGALPVVALNTLEAIAANVAAGTEDDEIRPILAVIDARRGQYYAQIFAPGLAALSPPAVLAAVAVLDLVPAQGALIAGSGAEAIFAHMDAAGMAAATKVMSACALPDAAVFGCAAFGRAAAPPPEPLYLRPPDAKPANPDRTVARRRQPT